MDLHHPPCRYFRATQAFPLCGQLAQMLLRGVQYHVLPQDARRHGLRQLIRLRDPSRGASGAYRAALAVRCQERLPARLAIARQRATGVVHNRSWANGIATLVPRVAGAPA